MEKGVVGTCREKVLASGDPGGWERQTGNRLATGLAAVALCSSTVSILNLSHKSPLLMCSNHGLAKQLGLLKYTQMDLLRRVIHTGQVTDSLT